MPTIELDARLLLQLASVANRAELVACWQITPGDTFSLKAGQALLFVLDSGTLVSTLLILATKG